MTKWRETFINTGHSDIHIGAWWDWAIRLVLVQAVVLMGWWLWSARGEGFEATWTLFSSYNIWTVLIQWGVVLVVLIAANRWYVSRTLASDEGGYPRPVTMDDEATGGLPPTA